MSNACSLTCLLTRQPIYSFTSKHSAEWCAAAWKQRRRQALSLKGTPDTDGSEQPLQTSPSLDFVRSSLPQLTQGKQAPQGSYQAKGADPDAPQGPDQATEADVTAPPSKAAGPRLPARVGKRSVPHVNHGQVLVSQDNQHPPDAAAPEAAAPKQQLPEEEEQQHASELQRHSAVSASQAGGTRQPPKKKKDRKEKKRKHKGSKRSSAAQESSAHQESSSLAETSDRGRSLSLEPSSAAADDDQTAMVRCWLLQLPAGPFGSLCSTRR